MHLHIFHITLLESISSYISCIPFLCMEYDINKKFLCQSHKDVAAGMKPEASSKTYPVLDKNCSLP